MRSLFDVNLLVALADEDHAFNERAHAWLQRHSSGGWASCALTELGFVRVLSNPNYSDRVRLSVNEVARMLRKFVERTDHEFWHAEVSLADGSVFDTRRIHGPRQLADVYLLALAVHHGGRLVTLDQGIPVSAVKTAAARNLCVI